MASVSTSFVYRRIIDEAWPKWERYLRSQAERSFQAGQIYQHSNDYKYQKKLISHIAQIWLHIKATASDIDHLKAVLGIYSSTESRQPEELRSLAHSATVLLS